MPARVDKPDGIGASRSKAIYSTGATGAESHEAVEIVTLALRPSGGGTKLWDKLGYSGIIYEKDDGTEDYEKGTGGPADKAAADAVASSTLKLAVRNGYLCPIKIVYRIPKTVARTAKDKSQQAQVYAPIVKMGSKTFFKDIEGSEYWGYPVVYAGFPTVSLR